MGKKMNLLNVIHVGKFKEYRENRRKNKSYANYLNTLANSQLEVEINILFDEHKDNQGHQDFVNKSQLILKEISSRAHYKVKEKIEDFDTVLRLVRPTP